MSKIFSDARVQYSIGTRQEPRLDNPVGLTFDARRRHLYVVDQCNFRIQVFSADDGSLLTGYCSSGYRGVEIGTPCGIAVDYDYDRILVTDASNCELQVWSRTQFSIQSLVGKSGTRERQFHQPRALALDRRWGRIVIADSKNNRVQVLSSDDLSFVFAVGRYGSRAGEFKNPTGVAVDSERSRIIVADSGNNRVQVLSSIDGSFLFEFGAQGYRLRTFTSPNIVCTDNHGRIIVSTAGTKALHAFTPQGQYISSFDGGNFDEFLLVRGIAFDEHRGLIAFMIDNHVHVIGANRWLPDTQFAWQVERHRFAPEPVQQVVKTVTMIRSLMLEPEAAFSLIPNELLFEIFSYL